MVYGRVASEALSAFSGPKQAAGAFWRASQNVFRWEASINGCVSGPHLLLAVEVVKLAVRDLADPRHSEEARAFLRGEPYEGSYPLIEPDLIAEILGYKGAWENNG